jgi:hypothetical protein
MFGIRKAFVNASLTYVRVARAFFFILLFMTPFMAAYAQSNGQQLTLTISNVNINTAPPGGGRGYNPGGTTVSGAVTVNGQWNDGPLHFSGWVVIYGYDPYGNYFSMNITITSGDFNPSSLNYPSQTSSSFSASSLGGFKQWTSYNILINAYDPNGSLVGTSSQQGTGNSESSNAMYILTVQLPLINDPMLGAVVYPGEPTIGPLGGMYNFILTIGLILVVIGALLAIFLYRDKMGMGTIMMNAVTSVVAIFLFPLIYNEVATLINAMDIALITFPNFAPTPDAAINSIWNAAYIGGLGSFWGVVWTGITEIAVWIMALIAWLMMNFLGIVRLFLISVLLVAFPLSMGMRLIPFTQKLSQMVDDTLYGLILASIMSAMVLGVAANVISNYNGSVFQTAIGNQTDWVAIAAIFAAILMPTVFAPLTGIMMQTVSQAAMAGAGVATMVGTGFGMPFAGGVLAGARSGMAALGTATQAAGAGGLGLGGALKAFLGGWSGKLGNQNVNMPGFMGTFKGHALRPMLSNAAILGTVGTLGAIGATPAAKQLAKMMPVTTHTDVIQSAEAANAVSTVNQHFNTLEEMAKKGVKYDPGHLKSPNTGRVYRRTSVQVNKDPFQQISKEYYSSLRDYYTNAPSQAIVEEAVKNKILPPEMLKNPKAIEAVGRLVRTRAAPFDPETQEGRLFLHNLKEFIDSEEFKVKEGLK